MRLAPIAVILLAARAAAADEPEVDSEPPPPAPSPSPGAVRTPPPPPEVEPSPEPAMSEGRRLVSAYHSGFQWGLAPGIVVVRGQVGFALGVRFGYGFDTGPVIVVPGVRLSAYFTDPKVFVGMPTVKLVIPIDRFAPFLEGGAGIGHVTDPSKSGLALLGGGGFMVHFRPVALGAEIAYQTITGTSFRGISFGPILALGF